MYRYLVVTAILNTATLSGVYAWWQVPVVELRSFENAEDMQLHPRINAREDMLLRECSPVSYTELETQQRRDLDAFLVYNSPRLRPNVDVLFFYKYKNCESDPVVVVKLHTPDRGSHGFVKPSLQAIDFKGLGIQVRPLATRGFSLNDPTVAPYLQDVPDANTAVWYFNHPVGKFVWIDSYVPTIGDTRTEDAMKAMLIHEGGPMTEGMMKDYDRYRRRTRDLDAERVEPDIDPFFGDKRLPNKFEDLLEGFKQAVSTDRARPWFQYFQNLHDMASFIFGNYAMLNEMTPDEVYQNFLRRPQDMIDRDSVTDSAAKSEAGPRENGNRGKKEEGIIKKDEDIVKTEGADHASVEEKIEKVEEVRMTDPKFSQPSQGADGEIQSGRLPSDSRAIDNDIRTQENESAAPLDANGDAPPKSNIQIKKKSKKKSSYADLPRKRAPAPRPKDTGPDNRGGPNDNILGFLEDLMAKPQPSRPPTNGSRRVKKMGNRDQNLGGAQNEIPPTSGARAYTSYALAGDDEGPGADDYEPAVEKRGKYGA
ncbi:hypothetical protein TWF281_006118 [Arthrobotrys megalospora]